MDAPCSDLDLHKISQKIVRWEELAPYFDVSPVEAEEIRNDRPFQYALQKLGMLWKWKLRMGYGATYGMLKEIFLTADDIALAEEVDQLLHKPYSPSPHDEKTEMEFVEKHIAEEGSLPVRIVHSILHGPPAVGKTCTRRRLTGSISDMNSLPSTGIEKPCTIILHHKTEQGSVLLSESLKEWEEQDVEAQCQTLLEYIMLVSQVGSDQTTQQPIEEVYQDPSLLASPEAEHSSITADLSHDPTVAVQTAVRDFDLPLSAAQRNLPKDIALRRFIQNITAAKKWKEVHERLKAIEDITILHITDTGGQPEFQDILPLLLQGPAIFLLFLNLTRSLHEHCEIAYRWEGGHCSTRYISQFTIKEMLFQLLASVASCSVDKLNAAVIFIGTYLDQAGEEGWHQREKELMDVIKSTELFEMDVVKAFTRHGKRSLIFPLDNIGGSLDEVKSLQNSMADIIEEALHPIHIPTSWLLFHLVLCSEYEANPGYCTLEQCKEVAEACGVPASVVVDILRFIHKRFGTILYYSDVPSLADIVICDPNVIFMHATKLVTLSFGANPDHPNKSEMIRNFGEIDPNLMEEEKKEEKSPFNMSQVVDLLTHYNVISHIKRSDGSQVFFMPCLLHPDPSVGKEKKLVLSGLDPAPLLILFNTGYVPLGLFSALTVYLSKLSLWVVDPDEQRYKNKIHFVVDKSTDLVLISHINCLELRVESVDSSIFATICPYVVSILREAIEFLKSCHKYFNFHNSLGFYCSSGLEVENESPHPASCLETECPQACWNQVTPVVMECLCKPQCAKSQSKLQDKHKVWFNQNSALPQQLPIPDDPTTDELKDSKIKQLQSNLNALEETISKLEQTITDSYIQTEKLETEVQDLIRNSDEKDATIKRSEAVFFELKTKKQNEISQLEQEIKKMKELLLAKSPAVTQDSSIQANYLSVIGESVRGVKECGETVLEITGSKYQKVSWEDYGFHLTVPNGAVSDDVTVSVAVKAIMGGQFELPDDAHLVSAIYWVSASERFHKPVSVHIQHCAIISSKEEASDYKFIVGKCSQESLPYTFKILDGVFLPQSQLATISVKQFSFFGTISQRLWGNKKIRYISHCYFKRDPVWTSCCEVRFLVTQNLSPCLRAIEEKYKYWTFHHTAEVKFEEKPQAGEGGGPASESITLKISAPKKRESKNWDIFQVVPLQISKQSVDDSSEDVGTDIPYCEFSIEWNGPETAKVPFFRRRINLIGAKAPDNFFNFHFRPLQSLPPQSGMKVGVGSKRRREHSKTGEGKSKTKKVRRDSATDAPAILTLEQLGDVKQELPNFNEWKKLGLRLGLTPGRLEVIKDDCGSADDCLDEVLKDWLRGNYDQDKYKSPTWNRLANALDTSTIDRALANTIRNKYCKT